MDIGYVAQSEERPAFNRVVVGSIPIMAKCLLEDVTFCCPVGSPLGGRVVLLGGQNKMYGGALPAHHPWWSLERSLAC